MTVSQVETIFDGVSWLRGMMPKNVWKEPDIANAFILKRNGEVYLVDTGVGSAFRSALARFFAGRTYKSATLINTHSHVDHVCNNDLLNEIDSREKRHLIHPAGVPYLDPYEWVKSILRLAGRAYTPFSFDTFPLSFLAVAGHMLERISAEAAYSLLARLSMRKFEPVRSRTPYLAPLSLRDRESLRIGVFAVRGWRLGTLLLLDDGAHSPDSIAVYDPQHRMLLLGDLTYEYDPLWPTGTYGRMIEHLELYRALAVAGEVSILGDGHHHRLFHGTPEILPLLDDLIARHTRRRAAVVAIATRRGTSSVDAIRRVLVAEDPEFAQMAAELEFPRAYCFTRAMIAVALAEMGKAEPSGSMIPKQRSA